MTRQRLWVGGVLGLALGALVLAADRFEQVTVDATSGGVALTSTKIDPPGGPQMKRGQCRVRTAEISVTKDGSVPTASFGTLAEPGDTVNLVNHDELFLFRAIRTGSTSGQLDCNYSQ